MSFSKTNQEFLNTISSNISDLKRELQNSDEKLDELRNQKTRLRKNMDALSTSVIQLKGKISKLRGDEYELKQKEIEVKDDIDRLSSLIEQSKEALEENNSLLEDEELTAVNQVNNYEQDCRNIVSVLKTLQPESENQDQKIKEEIEELERENALLEKKEQNLEGSKQKLLPFEEIRWSIDRLYLDLMKEERARDFYSSKITK